MSKYTRLNKINHYHDSNAMEATNYPHHHHHYHNNSHYRIENTETTDRTKLFVRSPATNKGRGQPHLNSNDTLQLSKLIRMTKASTAFFGSTKKSFLLISTLTLTILLAILIDHKVLSLKCYHCSSADNPNCGETMTIKNDSNLIEDTDCNKHIGREAVVCRRIVQYIEHKKVVIRSCGYIEESASLPAGQQNYGITPANGNQADDRKPICYKRSGTFAVMVESCNCYTDNCNHSASLKPNQSVLFLSSCFLVLLALLFIARDRKGS